MKILRVAQKLYPDVKGGGPYHVHALSRDQAAMGHDVTVLTVRSDPTLPHAEERNGYTVVRYDPTVELLGNDVSVGVGRYLAAVDGFDVMHAHSHLYFSTNLAALKRRVADLPLAITNHGLYSQTAPKWLFDLYLRSVGRWTFNRSDVVFCYTETDKERVREFGVTSPIEVVPNGIDTERFSPEGPESELIDGEGPVVLFVGRLIEGKRPGLALDAFAEVLNEYPDAELYLCGEGPLDEALKAQTVELEVGDSVTFLGHVPYHEMPTVYRSGDVLVLPSRAEGLPRTVMEALSSGVPVVSSDLSQVRGAFDEAKAVEYVEYGDVEEFAERIEGTLAGDRTASLDERFSWERTVAETTAKLEEIATGQL